MKKYLLWLLLCISSSVVYADEEDWYTYWAIGAADFDYPGNLGSELNSTEAVPGVDRSSAGFDLFGFYWPQAKNSLLGFVISGSTDSFKSRYERAQISHYLYGLSGMKFFGHEIGDGFFIRGDAGLARITVSYGYSGSPGSLTTVASDDGFGYLLGAGYAFPVSSESRILVSMNFSDKQINGNSWKSTTFTVGGLW